MAKVMTNQNIQLSTYEYHHYLAMMTCNPQEHYSFRSVMNVLDQINYKIYVTFKQRVPTNIKTLETTLNPSDEFTDMLIVELAV